MACALSPDPIALAPLMAPMITAGFGMTLFSKSIGPPAAIAALFWYVATYLAYFFDDDVAARVDFIMYPLGFYLVGTLMAAVLSQVGNYPRLFDFFDSLRTTYDAQSRIFDRRRTAWEGILAVLSIFGLYFGTLFLIGALSDGCLMVSESNARAIGSVLVAFGILGLLLVVLVTIFDTAPTNPMRPNSASIERRRMFKYLLVGIVLVGGHVLVNDLLAANNVVGVWYGLIGLLPVILVWAVLYWYITLAPFYSQQEADEAIKLVGADESRIDISNIAALDGFRIPERVIPFVVTGGLYNVLTVLIVWLVVILVPEDVALLYGLVAALVCTAVAISIVVVLSFTTSLYFSGVYKVPVTRV